MTRKISDFYYESLFLRDRLLQQLIDKYGSLHKAGLHIGKSYAYFYSACICKRLNTILEVCRKTGISIKWVLDKNENNPYAELWYNDLDITYGNLLRMGNSIFYKRLDKVRDKSSVSIFSKLRKTESCNISLSTLLYFSYYFNVKPIDLLYSDCLDLVA